MKRIASVIGLPPEGVERYEQLHAAVWPAVLERIAASHIVNYSIYRYGELLFSYMEYDGTDFDADMEAMGVDPVTQEWWDVCKPIQRPVEDREEGEWWKDLPEVFHVD
ncbi:L-rhamnose mutarotase [Rhodoglobus aureus]|uniref:L-rhamnose mutarotase n=1 Tax=Rhodoglobus aureus TaxID=191497 RepID=A0ABN1VER5_9MICO